MSNHQRVYVTNMSEPKETSIREQARRIPISQNPLGVYQMHRDHRPGDVYNEPHGTVFEHGVAYPRSHWSRLLQEQKPI